MLSTTLREIDSALRWEGVLQFCQRYMRLMLSVFFLVTLSGGVFFYYYTQNNQSIEEASAQYTEALQLFRREKNTEAENILHTLATRGPAPYNILAQFRLAGELAPKDSSAAVTLFDALANNPALDSTLRDAARMRSFFLRFETTNDFEAFEKELAPLLSPSNLWHSSAQELAGLLAWRTGNMDAAKMYFEIIRSDPQAPVSLQKRAGEFLDLITYSPEAQKEASSPQKKETTGQAISSKLNKKP